MGTLIHDSTPVPKPVDWARMHSLLSKAWKEKADPTIPQPPVPLILAGAAFSKASDIRQRWKALIWWTNDHGFSEALLGALTPPPVEDIAERIAGVSEDGQGWWPTFGDQYEKPKIRPSRDSVAAALKTLHEHWPDVAGPEISPHTKPYRFSGSKSRRLVVIADEAYAPPWGSWSFISKNPRTFTSFREAVNSAISPLAVDVITFRFGSKTSTGNP